MAILYKFLIVILIIVYLKCFIKLVNSKLVFSPIFGFIVGILYFILFPLFVLTMVGEFAVNPLSGAKGYWSSVDLSDDKYIYPYLLIWGSLFISGILVMLYPTKKLDLVVRKELLRNKSVELKVVYILLISMTIQIIDWLIIIIQFGGISNYLGYHWYMRNDLLFNSHGSFYILLTKFFHANKIIFTGTSILYLLKYSSKTNFNFRKSLFLFFIIVIHLLIIVLTGNRIYFAMFLLFSFCGFIFLKYKRPIILLLGLSPVLLFVFSAWSYTRSSLTNLDIALSYYIQSFSDIKYSITSMLFDISEGANVLAALHIISDYGKIYDFLNGATYLKVVAPIFPDFINKVDSFTVIAGSQYEPGTNLSLNSTILAEIYANFGIWMVLVLPIISILIMMVSSKINLFNHPVVSLILCSLTCWFVRSVFSDNFITIIIALFILVIEGFIYRMLVNVSYETKLKET